MMRFDIICGNPPYQGKKVGGGQGSGSIIWNKFVELSFYILKEEGFLCFIHPIHWRLTLNRKSLYKTQDILFNNQLLFLKLFTTPFDAQIVTDWYVLQKTPTHTTSQVYCLDGIFDKNIKREILCNYGSPQLDSILQKVFNTPDNGLYECKSFSGLTIFDKTKDKGVYPYAHGIKTFTQNIIKYFDYPHIHQYNKKVIIPDMNVKAYYDDGIFGISNHIHYVNVNTKEEGEFLTTVFNHRLMIFLQKNFVRDMWDYKKNLPKRWNTYYPFSRIKIDNVKLKDDEVYKYFGLTEEEINFINDSLRQV